CSTEAVLPQMLGKLERLGCAKPVVGIVLPTGYMFNADGTSIYMAMAAIFVAQATNTDLSLWDQLVVLGVLVITSKGSAGVAGAVLAKETNTEVTKATTAADDSKPNSDAVPEVYAINGQFERIVILRFKYQADLLAGLERMVKEQKIKNGVILSGIGSVRGYH